MPSARGADAKIKHAAPAERPTVGYPNNDAAAELRIRYAHARAERQCAVRGGKAGAPSRIVSGEPGETAPVRLAGKCHTWRHTWHHAWHRRCGQGRGRNNS
jgi:hypothetical protein